MLLKYLKTLQNSSWVTLFLSAVEVARSCWPASMVVIYMNRVGCSHKCDDIQHSLSNSKHSTEKASNTVNYGPEPSKLHDYLLMTLTMKQPLSMGSCATCCMFAMSAAAGMNCCRDSITGPSSHAGKLFPEGSCTAPQAAM